MGIFIGAYIKCTADTKMISTYYRYCPLAVCPNNTRRKNNSKFCSDCGTPLVDKEDDEKITQSLKKKMEFGIKLWSPVLFINDQHIYLSKVNEKNMGHDITFDELGIIPLEINDSLLHINNMKNTHKEDIEKLKEHYGRDKVCVKWGIINY